MAAMLSLVVMVPLVDSLLRRFKPTWALSAGERALILTMVLVGCSVPAVGLMRYLPGHLVGLWAIAENQPVYQPLLRETAPASWTMPAADGTDPDAGGRDLVVEGFYQPIGDVPWDAWVRPAMTWAIYLGALAAGVICLLLVFHRQWVENERLAFPLANVYGQLLAEPEPGRALSPIWRAPGLWIAVGAVFFLHGLAGAHHYAPKYVPEFSLSFDLRPYLGDTWLRYTQWSFRGQFVYFTIIGLCFFLRASTSLSLWLCYLLGQAWVIRQGIYGLTVDVPQMADQFNAAAFVMVVWTLWLARRYLAELLRLMWREPFGSWIARLAWL
ncbi:MAG TPA: hypothetical protein PKB10_08955, partial [Tepidisphaeraceae bacterium]|nr:hypothetical protein [Tepidisphaeraceae bacterium]